MKIQIHGKNVKILFIGQCIIFITLKHNGSKYE
jgi:hypothetical protein